MREFSGICRVAAAVFAVAAAVPAQATPFVYVTNQDDNTVSVIDTATNSVVATVPVGLKPYSAVVSKDNTKVYVANFNDNSVSVIDAYTNTVTATLANICTNPMYLALMPNGSQVWLTCFNGAQLKRIDVATNTVVATVSGQSRPSSLDFSPDGSRAYVVLNNNSSVRIINTATNATVSTLSTGFNTLNVVAAPDGQHVYSTALTDKRIWDTILQPPNYNWYQLTETPTHLVMSPDGTYIYTTTNSGNVWRIRAGQWTGIVAAGAGGGASGIDVTGDGSRLYVTNYNDNTVGVIDTATFARIATIPVGNRPTTYGRFVAKGPLPAVALPGPPTAVTAFAGINQVTVSFTPPADTGGGVILSYTAHCGTQSKTGTASPLLVTGLTNGVAVTCTVVATNSAGDSVPSQPSASVTPSAVLPEAPRTVQIVTAGSGEVSVSFQPPLFDGGATITEYRSTCGAVTRTGTASPMLVNGLTNGVPVSCTVAAINGIGAGPESAMSNTVIPGIAPAAPGNVVATPGDRELQVAFVPGDDGGFAVSNFHVVCGNRSVDGLQSPITVTSLTNGVAVSCTVIATNARGTSPPSTPSAPVAPATVPDAPVIGTATRGNGQVSVAFTPGAGDGGAPVTSFRASCGTTTSEAPASPIVVGGLANGTPVNCRVQAINAMGSGALSAASNTVTPATVPGPPQAVTAIAGVLNLSLNFQAPASNGGEAVTRYRATCGAQVVSDIAPPLSFGNLPAGVPLSCSVVAINAVGESTAATSNTVTPQGPPGTPTNVVATRGDGEVSVGFVPSSNDGGSAITGYLAICGTQTGKGSASPIVVGNLSNGVPVACGVIAFNAVGNSELSALSASVTPAGPPDAPTLTAANGGDGRIALSFDAPAGSNGAAVTGYTASCTPGTHETGGTQSPLTVSGLSNGTEYRCSLRASNEVGSGAASNALFATPRAVADLSISNSNGTDFLRGGGTVSYLIEVSNSSGVAVAGARVRDVVAAPLSGASWVCSGQGGGVCPAASGSGGIDALVDLPAGAVVSFLLSATVAATPETPVTNTATVTVPNGIADPNAANDTAVDGPDVVGISRDGFDGAPP